MEPIPRTRVPRYAPNPDIERLRAAGWTLAQIAGTLPASLREVYRWAAGDARPLAVYAERLAAIEDHPVAG